MSRPNLKDNGPDHGRPERSQPGEPSANRRRFMAVTAGVCGAGYAAMLGYPVYRYLASPVEKSAQEAAITEVVPPNAGQLPKGGAMIFRFGPRPALLLHLEDGSWKSYSAVCTHLGCTVQYESAKKRIFCACHGGVYDPRSGKPVSGPPPKGLTEYRVEVKENGEVHVYRS